MAKAKKPSSGRKAKARQRTHFTRSDLPEVYRMRHFIDGRQPPGRAPLARLPPADLPDLPWASVPPRLIAVGVRAAVTPAVKARIHAGRVIFKKLLPKRHPGTSPGRESANLVPIWTRPPVRKSASAWAQAAAARDSLQLKASASSL